MNRPHVATRASWLLVFGVLSASVFICGAAALLIEHNLNPRHINPAALALMRPFLNALALCALAVSLRIRVDSERNPGREIELSLALFLARSLTALALSEACATAGLALFFLGAPFKEFSLFALGTIVVDFAVILPRGFSYWASHEKRACSDVNPLNPNP